jgi:predicted acylesterase/phospholipase RssA
VAIQSPGLRYWPNINLELLFKVAADSNDRERRALALSGTQFLSLPAARFLVISGGGDDGAFGAGLLVGWTKRGDRPAFKVVTGVSAGALIAPFAFLGARVR